VHRWGTVGAYASVAAANQLLWLTFAPITTDAARHYGVSESAVGWLSQVFPLLYVVLAIPAGVALDRRFRPALLAGAWLTALGGAVRLGADTFAVALAGQLIVAIAQPLVLNAVTKVAAVSLPADSRPLGIALGSAGIFAGTALALPLGPALGDAESLRPLLVVDAVLAVAAAVALTVALRGLTGVPGAAVGVVRRELQGVWADPLVRRLTGVAFLGFGLFVAITTWLQALLEPAGVSDTTTGWLLGGMVLAGVLGSAVLPPPVARRALEIPYLRVAAVVAAAGCVVLAAVPGAVTGAVAIVPMGFVLLASLPVILELTERRAGAAGGSATALVWMAGNAGGIVVALLVQAAVHHPAPAFALLAVVALAVLPLTRR
jgi:predicted MFS family arabinose efflux permease